jgi:Uncharacterized enzyme of phosphonate metabolism
MDYTHIVEEGNIEVLKQIHDMIINQLPCRYISQPAIGKVVISYTDEQAKAREHVGDVSATYCEVEVDGNVGYGCVPGNDPDRARYAAVIDSIIWNQHPMENEINPLLEIIRNELLRKWNNQLKELCG